MAGSLRTRVVCGFIRITMRGSFLTEEAGEKTLARAKGSSAPPTWLSNAYAVTRRVVGGFDTHRVVAPGGRRNDRAVVYLHGGSYANEIAKQHWRLIADLADATGSAIEVPIYGLAPQHTATEAVDFVTSVVRGLDTDHLHLAGDSAGGGLALLVAQRLRDEGDSSVRGITVIAPWVDLAMSNPGIEAIERVDPWLARPAFRPIARAFAPGVDLADPGVSPINAVLTDLAPITVYVGTRDITLADTRLLRDRVIAAGGEITVHEAPGSPHVHPLLPTPEGRAARRSFIETVTRR